MTTSVIIACYNGEKYILEQLESIRTQTVKPDEVLICDDCSTDNTFEITQEYIALHQLNNWHIYKNEVNQGWKVNFAKLIGQATMDTLILCDHDDIWYPDKLQIQIAAMESDPRLQMVVCGLDVKYMAQDMHPYNPERLGDQPFQKVRLQPRWLRIMRPGCAFAVRREFAQTCFAKYWHDGLAHDLFLWQCAFLCDTIGTIQKPLFAYRRFPTSATAGKTGSKADFRIIENQIFLESLDAACGVYNETRWISSGARKMAQRCFALETKRKKFFQTKNIFVWLSCLRQIDCYPFAKSWLADLYHICIKQ